jgi:hypothetical protein
MSEIPKAKDNQAKAKEKAMDLKAKGYTLDDIRKAGALETELVSDKPTTEAGHSTLSRFNPEAVKSLETAFEALEMEEGESGAIAGEQLRVDPRQEGEIEGGKVWEQREPDVVLDTSQDFSFGDEAELEAFDFGEVESIPFMPMLTEHASKEQATLASAKTGAPVEMIQKQIKAGDYRMVSEASNAFGEEFYGDMFSLYEKNIAEANTPKEVGVLLKELEQELQRKPTLAEQRANYTKHVIRTSRGYEGETDIESLHPVLRESVKNNMMANNLSKMQMEHDNSLTYLGMFVDFAELTTLVGAGSEELLKNTSDIYDNLDKMDGLPFDKQMALMESMVEAAKNQETYLFNNNNSFIAGGQIDTIYNAVLEGARMRSEGYTEAEVGSMLETAFNGTLFFTQAAGLAKSIGAMGKFLMRRIHSSKNLAAAAKEQEELMQGILRSEAISRLSPDNAQYRMEGTSPTAPQIIEKTTDKRDVLTKTASAKGSRKERKALESEKKDLAVLLNKTESEDLNKKARLLSKDKKIKFKMALKEVKAENGAFKTTIKDRQKVNQELITDFDTAAKAESDLSRTDTMLRDGRLKTSDVLVPNGEFAVSSIQSPTINPTGLRPNQGLFDTLYKFVPDKLSAIRGTKGIKGLVEETGLTPEEVAERLAPTPNPETEQGFAYINETRFLNDLIFVDENIMPAEGIKHSIGQALGRELEKPMGTSLTPDYSATGFKHNNVKGSLGTFTYLLGDGALGGFKTADEATDAMEQAAVGYKYKVVKKENGFFVETELDHYYNPYSDVAGLQIKGTTPSWAISWALNRYRNVEEDLVRGLAAMKNVNRSLMQKMEDRAKGAVRPLSAEQNKLLLDVLERGDSLEEEWFDLARLNEDLGLDVPDEVWKSYREIRGIYNDIYTIREKNYYNKLRTAQQKYIDFGDGEDLGIGKAVKHDGIDTDMVYDSVSKKVIDTKELPQDAIVVKLGVPKKVGEEYYTHTIVQPKQIKPLVAGRTLNRRKGHIDRMYRDAGWIVEVPAKVARIVDGKEVLKPTVTHIVKTEAQAKKIASKTEGAEAKPSRETESLESDIYGDSESVQFGYGASHLKHRGEKVKGSDGIEGADTLNAFESLFKGIGNLSSALDYNAYQAVRIKFNKGFAEYFKEGAIAEFKPDWDSMVSADGMKKLNANPAMKTELINHHAYLKSLRENARGKIFQAIDRGLRPILAPLRFDPSTQKAATDLQRLTSELYIVWNGLYQGVQNLVPVFYNMSTGGTSGVKAVAMLPAVMLAFKTGNLKPLTHLVGDEALALELFEELSTNGLIDAVGRSNDFLDLARTEGATVALSRTKASARGVKKALYGAPRQLSLGLQESAIVTNNALAYLLEFNELRKAGRAFDGKGKADISFQAQKRTQSQNSLDRFTYQNQGSVVAMAGQFMQAVHKFFLDAVIEPQWEVIRKPINALLKPVTDKHLGSLGKNKGRFADTWNKAFITTLVTYGMFGLEGGMGKGLGMALEDHIRKQYEPDEIPAILDALLDGGLNTAINSLITDGGSVDVNATMSPSAFVDMFTSLVFADFPQVNMVGASGFALAGIFESAYSSVQSIRASWKSEDIDWTDAAGNVFLEVLENFKIMDTAVKSYIIYWTGRNTSARSLTSELPIMKSEAIAKNLGIQSEMAADYFYRTNFGKLSLKGDDKDAAAITDTMLQMYARDAIGMATGNALMGDGDVKLGFEEQNELRSKYIATAKLLTDPEYHPNIEKAFYNRGIKFGSAGHEIYMKPYLKKAVAGNITEYYKLVEQRAPEGKGRETMKHIREGQAILEGK